VIWKQRLVLAVLVWRPLLFALPMIGASPMAVDSAIQQGP
jgi:hypothetical protein